MSRIRKTILIRTPWRAFLAHTGKVSKFQFTKSELFSDEKLAKFDIVRNTKLLRHNRTPCSTCLDTVLQVLLDQDTRQNVSQKLYG